MKKLERPVRYDYNEYEGDERKFTFKPWENYGKSRIYMTDYKGRTIGYIDRADGKFNLADKQGITEELIKSGIDKLAAEYELKNS